MTRFTVVTFLLGLTGFYVFLSIYIFVYFISHRLSSPSPARASRQDRQTPAPESQD
jgi:hypothetical protein